MITHRNCAMLTVLAAIAATIACNEAPRVVERTPDEATASVTLPTLADALPVDLPGLPNVVAYATGLFSGGAPEGDEGFETLRSMGVKTILSVDGAQPDVDAAKALGMRYVHLPIGYNGMDKPRTLEIARAVKELPGPIYIHCHHGKHRAAGATGAAAVTLGYMSNAEATQRMHVSGTSPHYVGLYRCVAVASVANDQEILAAANAFPERWRTTGLVHSMVEIDEASEHLKRIQSADWKAPAAHPDLVPAAEAGRLADLFRNLQDDDDCRSKPAEFMEWMLAASHDASQLETEITSPTPSLERLDRQWGRLKDSCTHCHAKYRD
ncbi:MAG: hypothetical protein H6818_00430 [Phycisphaerales bacterium]|nr:hypothetical protein [Phycisphaerales bacterium]